MNAPSDLPKPDDAIVLLMQDHANVTRQFKQYEELGPRAQASKQRLAKQICDALIAHTTIEEEIFYPAVDALGRDAHDLIDEAMVEHASAKELIAQIQSMTPQEDLFDAKVKVLSEQIAHHVQEEEEQVFPRARKSKLDLIALGQAMAQRKHEVTQNGT